MVFNLSRSYWCLKNEWQGQRRWQKRAKQCRSCHLGQKYAIYFYLHHVCRSGPCNQKKTENWTRPNQLGPDQQLRLHAFQTMQLDWFQRQVVAHVIRLKNAHILSPFWGETDQNCMSYGQNDMFWQNLTLCNIS